MISLHHIMTSLEQLARSQLPVYDGFSNRVLLMLTRWPTYALFGDFLGQLFIVSFL